MVKKPTYEELEQRVEDLEKEAADYLRNKKVLQNIEENYRRLIENSQESVVVTQKGRFVYVNPKMIQMLGYSEKELKTMRMLKTIYADDREWVSGNHLKRLRGEPVPNEFLGRLLTKDGQVKWAQMYVVSTKWRGQPAVLAFASDTTERKRADESEEKYRILFENTGAATIIIEGNEIISAINRKFEELTGYPQSEVKGKKFTTTLVARENRESVMDYFRGIREGKEEVPNEYECRMVKSDGNVINALIQVGIIPSSREFITSIVDITTRKREEEALREREESLRTENTRLRSSIRERYKLGEIIGKSEVMQQVYDVILQAASTDASVVVYGESGTGKELVAKAIHDMGSRCEKNFVPVNCAAVPENILESEFFGYKKGAFTGAYQDKPGYFDLADGGTLFLDEIGEISVKMQAKLLRAIEGGGYTPIGSAQLKKANIRIIAATQRNLKNMVKEGLFREDFFYRIHIIPIYVPPLRDRKGDIPLLIYHFLEQYESNKESASIPAKIMDTLMGYNWPGNVRELQNAIRRYITQKNLEFIEVPKSFGTDNILSKEVEQEGHKLRFVVRNFEKKYITRVLEKNQWHRVKVASILGVHRRTLSRKIKS
jgi:PAS domain S-box-containing protein